MGRIHTRQSGVTLIELLTIVVITGILLAVALPNFADVIERNRIVAQANDLNAALSYARIEAVKRNLEVGICPANAAGTACAADWNVGWLVWADNDRNGAFTAGETIRSGNLEAKDGLVVVNGATVATTDVRFGARGTRTLPANGATFTLKPDSCAAGRPLVRRMIISAAGAVMNLCITCGTEGDLIPTRCN